MTGNEKVIKFLGVTFILVFFYSMVIASNWDSGTPNWTSTTANDYNTGTGYDYNHTKTTSDGNIMPTGELTQPTTAPPSGGLVGYWKLDSNNATIAADSSGNGNNGTWTNGADSNGTWFYDSNAGYFDGVNDYVDIPYINLSSGLTYSVWFKRLGSGDMGLFTLMGSYILITNTSLKWYPDKDMSSVSQTWTQNTNWNYIAVTQVGNNASIYFNGVLIKNNPAATAVDNRSYNMDFIGFYSTSYWNGSISSVKIFSRALTAGEIANEYHRGQDGNGLVAYYTFNDTNSSDTGITDQAGQDNNALMINGADNNALGLWDTNAGYFDGVNDYVDLGLGSDLNITDAITISAWVKLNSIPAADSATIISKSGGETADTTFWMDIRTAGTVVIFGGYTPAGGVAYTTASYTFSANVWYHIVGVDNGSNLIIYVNGKSIGSGPRATRTSGNWSVRIGRRGTTLGAYFPGLIEELKIYNRALSASEILADYNSWTKANYDSPIKDMNAPATIQGIKWDAIFGSAQQTQLDRDVNLVAWWRFNEKSGTTILDSGHNAINGTLTSGADINGLSPFDDNALYSDGVNDYVDLGKNLPDFNFEKGSFAFSLWINPHDFNNVSSGTQIRPFEIAYCTASPSYMYISIIKQNAGVDKSAINFYGLDSDDVTEYTSTDTNSISLNQWQHVAFSMDRTTNLGKAYVNGKQSGATNALTWTGDFNCEQVTSGAFLGSWWGTFQFKGLLDEFRVFDRAITEEEIRTLYASGINDLNLSVRICADASCATHDGNWAEFDRGNRYHSLDANAGLVLDINFNDTNATGNGVLDASGQGNHGLLINGADINAVGKDKSRAGYFDGVNDAVNAGTLGDAALTENGPVTISAWIKPASLGEGGEGRIVHKANPIYGPSFYIGGTNRLYFSVNGVTELFRVSANNSITLGIWQHVLMTWDGSTTATNVKLYINGIETSYYLTQNGVSLTDNLNESLYIGNRAAGDRTFDGFIDNVKIYNRALSAGEIMGLYLQGNPMQFVQYRGELIHNDANFPIGYPYLNDVAIEYNRVPDANIAAVDNNAAENVFPWFSYAKDGNLTVDFNVTDRDNFDPKVGEIFYSTTNDYGGSKRIASNLKVDGNKCNTNLIRGYTTPGSDVNLVGYWKFDGTDASNILEVDSSGQANNGQYINGADNNAQGKWDTNAGYFDGVNDRIDVGWSDDLNFAASRAMTITSWVYRKSNTSYDVIVAEYNSVNYGNFYFYYSSGALYIYRRDPTGNNLSFTSPATNQWQHVAAVLDYGTGNTTKLYVDGKQVASAANGGDLNFQYALPLNIGGLNWGNSFDGLIEELKIYNRALTAAEISMDYNYGVQNQRKCSQDWNISGFSDANYYVGVQVNDSVGNSDFNTTLYSLGVDNNSAVTIDNDFNNAWQNTDANIQLKCTDTGGSGCKNLYYSIGDVNYLLGWGSADQNIGIVLNTDGNYRIYYWSDDKEDHNAAAKRIHMAIDKTKPTTINSNPTNQWSSVDVNVNFKCTDNNAGCKNFYYGIVGDTNYQKSWGIGDANIGIVLSTDANHHIFYWSDDNTTGVGDNNEAVHLIYVAISKTLPGGGGESGGGPGLPAISVLDVNYTISSAGKLTVETRLDGNLIVVDSIKVFIVFEPEFIKDAFTGELIRLDKIKNYNYVQKEDGIYEFNIGREDLTKGKSLLIEIEKGNLKKSLYIDKIEIPKELEITKDPPIKKNYMILTVIVIIVIVCILFFVIIKRKRRKEKNQ